MTNRREFLQIGIAASTLPLASKAARASGIAAPEQPLVPLYKVIYDERFPQSVAFAERAKELGLAVAPIEGDMTRVWYDDLYHRWRQGPAAIAGLTAHGAMFCFERLAWDQGMRVVFRGMHTVAADGFVSHALAGPRGMLRGLSGLQAASAGDGGSQAASARDGGSPGAAGSWAASMADVVARCPSGRAEMHTAAVSRSAVSQAPATPATILEGIRLDAPGPAPVVGGAFGFDTDALYSWVIAPATKA